MQDRIHDKFSGLFGGEGTFYASAGRVNLIGEHTDYNGGYVFPGAIDKGMTAEIRPNGTRTARIYSLYFDEGCFFSLDSGEAPSELWAKYIYGVCREMAGRGALIEGFDAVFNGDVPIGSGMSSSAALECCFAYALNDIFQCGFDLLELARIGQDAEHNYCGVLCGIMDQFASCFGRKGQLICLNCKTMQYEYHRFEPSGYSLVLIDSRVKHELASSAYNRRRRSCEKVLAAVRSYHPGVETLGECPRVWLEDVRGLVGTEDFMRAEYVIGEQGRVLDACDALERGDYRTLGELMYQTHFGLSRIYEVSCPEIDFLNDLARKMEVTGSRVMGGGFGGGTINLVADSMHDGFISETVRRFRDKFGHEPKSYDVVISDGARKL